MSENPRKFGELLTKGVYAIRAAEPHKTIKLIQHELGEALGIGNGNSSLNYWRRGHIPFEWRQVEELAVQFMRRAHVDHAWVARFLDSAGAPNPQLLADQLYARALGNPLRTAQTTSAVSNAPYHFTLGPLKTPLVIIDGNGRDSYTPETVHCHYDPTPTTLPPEIVAIKDKITAEQDARRRAGQHYMWNGLIYGLKRYSRGRTQDDERMEINLWFKPADWFWECATGLSLDKETVYDSQTGRQVTLREKYMAPVDWTDPAVQPVPEIANSFGVALALLTADQHLVFTVRSGLVGAMPGVHNIAINEGAYRPTDRSEFGDQPDLYRTVKRGAYEELGLELRTEDIMLLALTVDTDQSDWVFLGYAQTQLTLSEVYDKRRLSAKDRWEIAQLEAVPFTPRAALQYIATHRPWSPAALASTYYTLVNHFGAKAVDAAVRTFLHNADRSDS